MKYPELQLSFPHARCAFASQKLDARMRAAILAILILRLMRTDLTTRREP